MMNSAHIPILGVTMGDPGGIGPEVCAQALALPEINKICRPLLIGDLAPMQRAIDACGLSIGLRPCHTVENARFAAGTIAILEMKKLSATDLRLGTETALQGEASFCYVAKAIELALAERIHGTVTGPINKAAVNLAGHHYAGHTEIYADLTRTRDYAMMLAEGQFRVAHVSTHVSLREACDRVKMARVQRVIQLTHEALRRMGLPAPRIAVAGLNPHCGEGGLFGTEDREEIAPAVLEANRQGIQVEGPLPADTVFCKMKGGMFDAVVVMYHDQGHIPTKLTGFTYDHEKGTWLQMAGVNITLGLPIIRTSVDHGTAFDIAGKGIANPQSMVEAIKMATQLATGCRFLSI